MKANAEPAPSPNPRDAATQEDDDAWEALDESPVSTQTEAAAHATAVAQPGTTALVPSLQNSLSKRSTAGDSVLTLRRRVETRRTLQQHLVEHPLQIFWSHFLWHLAQEFWHLDVKIRTALLFIAMGAGCKIFMLMTWYLYYPKMIMMSLIMLISWIYLYPDDIAYKIENFFNSIFTLPNRIPQALEHMDIEQARIVCLLGFFVPTLLQTRTIIALAGINAAGGSFLWILLVAVFMTGSSAFFITPPRSKSARDVSQVCLVVLYGSALWITICHFRILSAPRLAAPFFLSTGTLLLAYEGNDSMEWCSNLVRCALRLTLRDVLASVGNSVQEDEMLQLALLRWIVDYWSYTPSQHQQASNAPTPNVVPPNAAASESTPPSAYTPNQDLQWDELYPMLGTAADQMASEVHSLQQLQLQQQNELPPQQAAPSPTPGQPTTTTPAGGSAAAGTSTNTHASTNNQTPDNPLQSLHDMLKSMNVDGRAKPAVEAYKHRVENFPPSRDMALLISVIRRCPACLALLWQLLVASMFQSSAQICAMVLVLSPMVVLDLVRVRSWVNACESLSHMMDGTNPRVPAESATQQSTSTASTSFLHGVLPDADPMTVLLSGDDDVMEASVVIATNETTTTVTRQMKIPTLLIVWRNMESSVSALESSLTAARCVQTGAIAVDFAQNVISLAQFGTEVHKHGWGHGLMVIAKEVILHHQGDINSAPRGSETTFTYAAVNAVRNGQRVAHHLGVLAEEEGPVGQIVAPIVGFFGFVGGLFDQNKNNVEDGSTSNVGSTGNTTHGFSNENEEEDEPESAADAPVEHGEGWEATTTAKNSREATNTTATVQEVPLSPQEKEEEQFAQELLGKEAQLKELLGEKGFTEPASTAGSNRPSATVVDTTTDVFESIESDESACAVVEEKTEQTSKDGGAATVEASSSRFEPTDVAAQPTEDSRADPEVSSVPAQQSKALEASSNAAIDTSNAQETVEELGACMELIAEAYERSVIDEVSFQALRQPTLPSAHTVLSHHFSFALRSLRKTSSA